MKIHTQSGFAAIEAILVLIVLAILGFTGWFVYHSKQVTDKTLATTANSNLQKPIKPAPSSLAPSSLQPQKYLDIKEWGVKAEYTSQDDTLSYSMAPEKNLATIITSKLATTLGCTDSGGGYISRLKASDQAMGYAPDTNRLPQVSADAQTHPNKYVHIGQYFYYYETEHQSACGHESTLADTQLKSQEDQFVATVVAKLVADN